MYLKENKTDSLTFLPLLVGREKQNDRNGGESFPGCFGLPRWWPCQIPDPRAAPKSQNPNPGERSPSQFPVGSPPPRTPPWGLTLIGALRNHMMLCYSRRNFVCVCVHVRCVAGYNSGFLVKLGLNHSN